MSLNAFIEVVHEIQGFLPLVDDRVLSLEFCLSASCIAFAIGNKLGDRLFEPVYTILFHLFVIMIFVIFLIKF